MCHPSRADYCFHCTILYLFSFVFIFYLIFFYKGIWNLRNIKTIIQTVSGTVSYESIDLSHFLFPSEIRLKRLVPGSIIIIELSWVPANNSSLSALHIYTAFLSQQKGSSEDRNKEMRPAVPFGWAVPVWALMFYQLKNIKTES